MARIHFVVAQEEHRPPQPTPMDPPVRITNKRKVNRLSCVCVCVCILLCLPLFFFQFFSAVHLLLIVHSETVNTSIVAAVATTSRPRRPIKRPEHHDGTPLLISVPAKRSKNGAAAEKASKKKAAHAAKIAKEKKANHAAKIAKEKKDDVVKAAAKAEEERKAEENRIAGEEQKRVEKEGLQLDAAEMIPDGDKKQPALETPEEAEGKQDAIVDYSAYEKKVDDHFKNGYLKIGSKIDVYKDGNEAFIASTCVLVSVNKEGRTAEVVYEDDEDDKVVPLDLVKTDFDISLISKDEEIGDWTMPESITNTNKRDSDGASSQLEQLALLKSLQQQFMALSEKISEPNAKEKEETEPKEPKRLVATRANSVKQMKDETVRRMYDVSAKMTEQVQFTSQFKSQVDRDYHPPFWTVIMNVDKLVLKPSAKGLTRYEKLEPVVNMFAQPGIPVLELAKNLRNAAENMEKGISKGWTLASGTEEFVTNTFGPRENEIPKKKKEVVAAMAAEREELEQQELEEKEAAATAALLEPNSNQKQGETREL